MSRGSGQSFSIMTGGWVAHHDELPGFDVHVRAAPGPGEKWQCTGLRIVPVDERAVLTSGALHALPLARLVERSRMALGLDIAGLLRGSRGRYATQAERDLHRSTVTKIYKAVTAHGGNRADAAQQIRQHYRVSRATAFNWLTDYIPRQKEDQR